MNYSPSSFHISGTSRVISLLAVMILGAGTQVAAATANSMPNPEKTHTLFMGADFDIQQGHALYRVQDVAGGAFIIKKNNELVHVAMNGGNVAMRIYQELKLTDYSATIQDLRKERTYTPQNDPEVKFMHESQNFAGASAVQDIAQIKLDYWNAAAKSGGGQGQPAGAMATIGQNQIKAAMDVSNAASEARSTLNDPGAQAGKMEDELAKQLFDAMKVSFVVSSPRTLHNPYLVLVVQYRESQEKPGEAHNWIYASELDTIDQQPHKVQILRGGLPPGFILEKFQIHLYNRGHEVATNASDRKLALTRDEAFDYVLVDYLGTHKGATLSASPAMGRLSPQARAQLADDQYVQPYYVKVNKDGAPVGEYLDEACTQKVGDPKVAALIDLVRFTPALDKGHPVDGVAKLKLNELTF